MKKRLVGALIFSLALSACAGASLHRYPHDTTHILSPLASGAVASNFVQVASTLTEQRYGVAQGALVDDGVLTVLDTNQICVQVTLRSIGEERTAATSLAMYHVYLRANQNVRDDAHVTNVTQSVQSIPGTRPRQVQNGFENVCVSYGQNGYCYQWQQQPTYMTVYDPVMYDMVTQQGTACFVNSGYVTEDTDEMEIYFVLPDRSDGVGFEWRFDIPE